MRSAGRRARTASLIELVTALGSSVTRPCPSERIASLTFAMASSNAPTNFGSSTARSIAFVSFALFDGRPEARPQRGADLLGQQVVHGWRRQERVGRAAGSGRVEDGALGGPRAVGHRGRDEPDRHEHAGDGSRSHSACCRRSNRSAGGGDVRPPPPSRGAAAQPAWRATASAAATARSGCEVAAPNPAGPDRGGRPEIGVELVHERLARGQVELHHLGRRQAVEMLHERPQRVPVRGHEHRRAQIGGRARSRPPTRAASVRARPSRHSARGQHVGGQGRVALVDPRVRVVDRPWARAGRRRSVARSSPAPARTPSRSRPCSCPGARRSGARSTATFVARESRTARTRCSASSAVWIARVCNEVCSTSAAMPASARSRPARAACARPSSVRPTSTHPVNRFSRFHVLWPWRNSTSV